MLIASLSIDDVNSLLSDNFIKIFGNVVEHYPTAAIGILKNRPFADVSDVREAFYNYLDGLSLSGSLAKLVADKRKVLKLQSNLQEKLTNLQKIFVDSNEQYEKLGLNTLSHEQKSMLHNMNEEYNNKFGLPFVLCIKDVTIQYILAALTERLDNELDDEIEAGIEEVKKISAFRISQIVKEN